jgi:VWFA-related protein
MKFRLIALLLSIPLIAAQNDVIRVNTRLVQVDVVVRSKDGPIADLTKEDFTVFDNGKPQRVEVFSISSAARTQARNEPALPAGVITNRSANAMPSSATVILFDRLNTADIYQREGRVQLLSYLKSARREDLTAIYVLGDSLNVIQDFTNDSEKLVRAATKMEVGDLPGVENRTVQEIAQSTAVGRVSRRDVRVAVAETEMSFIQRMDPTEDAVEFIARHLSGLPGRKSLIWMSAAGIPLAITAGSSRDGHESQIDHITRVLTSASIAVYPVDLRGLKAPDPPRGRRGLAPNPPPDVMIRLADGTGGRAFYFNNDLEGSIRTAIADAQVSYTLGFYPTENAFDGKFHNLDVKVARRDVEVRHRTGYFALKENAPTSKERATMMSELMSSPFDSSQIGLQTLLQTVPENPKAFRVILRVDAADLHLERQNDRWTGKLDIAMHLESSKQKTAQIREIPINLDEQSFRNALLRGMLLTETVTTDKASDRVRIVIQDQATGSAGSLWVPLNNGVK